MFLFCRSLGEEALEDVKEATDPAAIGQLFDRLDTIKNDHELMDVANDFVFQLLHLAQDEVDRRRRQIQVLRNSIVPRSLTKQHGFIWQCCHLLSDVLNENAISLLFYFENVFFFKKHLKSRPPCTCMFFF